MRNWRSTWGYDDVLWPTDQEAVEPPPTWPESNGAPAQPHAMVLEETSLGAFFKTERLKLRLTKEEMAKYLGLAQNTYLRLENTGRVNLRNLRGPLEVLGCRLTIAKDGTPIAAI